MIREAIDRIRVERNTRRTISDRLRTLAGKSFIPRETQAPISEDTGAKEPRPSWWVPPTLEAALSERIDLAQLYESSRRKPGKTHQTWGVRITEYGDQTALDQFHGIRLEKYAETKQLLDETHGTKMAEQNARAASEIAYRRAHEIMAERQREEILFAEGRTDPLTGLPIRRLFWERVDALQKEGVKWGVVFLDLDRFKLINDDPELGHDVGDLILVQAAERASKSVRQAPITMPNGMHEDIDLRSTDLAARFGGEEVVVLVSGIETAEELEVVGQRLVTAINSRPFFTHKDNPSKSIVVTASAGGALPRPGENPTDTVKRADVKLYEAKAAGRNRYVGEEANIPTLT